MASDLRERLQASLGSAYTLERELGGGGCAYPDIARAYDLAGQADTAIAFLERYVTQSAYPTDRVIEDGRSRAGSHKRLAELYDAKGDRAKAISHYTQFIELWKNADADLQPHVAKARERLAQLQRAER